MLSGAEARAQVNVTQEYNKPSRDGVYIDAGFTLSAGANLTRGAILADLGMNFAAFKGIFMIAHTPGLISHVI
jgi:hypothetical protein